MAPPISIVLINSKSNDSFSDVHRRLIARISPVCYAYKFHLILVNFKIDESPINFAKEIAPTTSIGKSGERLVELAKKGMLRIIKLPLTGNFGKTIICTSKPDKAKVKNHERIMAISRKEKIALVFGCDKNRNKNVRRLIESAYAHLDVSGKGIELSIDTEMGAISSILKESK